MKPTIAMCSVFVALTTAIIVLNPSALAQSRTARAGSNGDRVAGEAIRPDTGNELVANPQAPIWSAQKAREAAASAAIGLLPADILVPKTQPGAVETHYAATSGQLTFSRPAIPGNDNDENAALAMKLRNPVSSLARISFDNSVDFGLAADREGFRITMNIEPVLPISLNKDWNLISRTILPFIQQDGIVRSSVQTGFADILQSVFVSPSKTEPFFWGAGAAVLLPTATDTKIGAGRLALGPTLAIGRQQGGWTYGALARHMWSVAGHRDRADVRSTFVRPFVAYTTKSAWTLSLDTESTYDWLGKQWSAPIHLELTKVVRFVRQPVSVGAAARCWAATFPGGPQACGVRFSITPLFPAR
jgi:hypothetical protein